MLSEGSEERVRALVSIPFFRLSRQGKGAAVKDRVKIEIDRGCYRQWKEDEEKTAGEEKEGHRGGPDNRPSICGFGKLRFFCYVMSPVEILARYEYTLDITWYSVWTP